MIVDLADAAQRGRMVGAYYFTRGLVVMPASLIGGLLWTLAPQAPFFVAAGMCLLGVALMVSGKDLRDGVCCVKTERWPTLFPAYRTFWCIRESSPRM